ncbi:phosphate/phosphite/phosphonate ABC transporter substrate-binding protein [Mycobacterium sp. CPCC 205372]|uniref:Phosphate/phosphite/phosphonate ABC transporter substrate-binding protein n=1 Tax=Mycobacterium hippophais TaxID=3016340 RepID=A0ABT4Q0V1_9MYCO|nr:phosphate/phosphite/phosphonate ABC transporter substrate-binding protein [Mycobacterium hippophais]MCZ8382473.1 phosphate/phosphite/phosphonate ABC transporter substrate-binding protein [Mycobacterium hippophais]
MKIRARRSALTAAAVVSSFALALSGCSGSDSGSDAKTGQGFPETLTLAAVPAENSADLKASYEPLIKLLEKETGSKVEFVQASDYAGVVEGMIADNVDLAFFGPFAYVVAGLNGAKITPLGAVIEEKGAEPGYQSYGLAKADNASVNGLKDFAGKKVCFVDPSSTSGFLYPSAGLIEEGVIKSGSEADISAAMTPIYAGGHDASALSIKSGDCDAGFAFDSMVDETMIEKGDLAPGDLKTVWKSEMIAGSVFAANDDLGTEAVDKLKSLFTEKANAEVMQSEGFCEGDGCLITDERAWGVVAVDDSAYDGVRKVCEVTGSEKCKS